MSSKEFLDVIDLDKLDSPKLITSINARILNINKEKLVRGSINKNTSYRQKSIMVMDENNSEATLKITLWNAFIEEFNELNFKCYDKINITNLELELNNTIYNWGTSNYVANISSKNIQKPIIVKLNQKINPELIQFKKINSINEQFNYKIINLKAKIIEINKSNQYLKLKDTTGSIFLKFYKEHKNLIDNLLLNRLYIFFGILAISKEIDNELENSLSIYESSKIQIINI